jgi:pseudouridine kinase
MASPAGDDVWVVGAANMDIAGHSHAPLLRGDSNPGDIEFSPGGVARNVAENLARLGPPSRRVRLVSAVGADEFGQRLITTTRASGVDTGLVQVFDDARTATYLSLHGPDGDMALAVNDMAILARLTVDLLMPFKPMLEAGACAVLDCNLNDATLQWLLHDCALGPVFVDGVSAAKCSKIKPWLARIHTLKLNWLEAQALLGWTGAAVGVQGPGEGAALAESLVQAGRVALELHTLGVANVVISLGAMGVCWCDAKSQTGHRRARALPVVSTSGVGDAMLAGLVQAHGDGLPLSRAVEFAMACAEITMGSRYANAQDLSLSAVQHHLQNT